MTNIEMHFRNMYDVRTIEIETRDDITFVRINDCDDTTFAGVMIDDRAIEFQHASFDDRIHIQFNV